MLICLDQRTGTGCVTENKDGAQFCRQCGRPLRFALQLRNPGDLVGAYRVAGVIGHGGFGAVYVAETQQIPGQRVALKETFDPDQIQNYQAEFAVLARLQHPHLPRYHTVFEADGNGYLVMEYVPGQSLQEVLEKQQGPLLEAVVMGYAIQLCDVLAFLHSQTPPIIHRDIKPANVRLTPEGLIKLVDFGLVKEGGGATRSSRRGVTPAYAPPEQWGMGGQHTDPRSDIYALGATLYHLCTWQEPLPATDRISATPDPLPAPQAVNRSLSAVMADAVTAAMTMSVTQRPADAQTLKRLLFQQTPMPAASPPQPAAPPPKPAMPQVVIPAPVAPPPKPAAPQVVIPAPAVQKPDKSAGTGIEWITIPGGEFLMGSDKRQDKQAFDDELPQHKVNLPAYRIAKYPITNAQYSAFVQATGHRAPSHWSGGHTPTGKEHHPVVQVSWQDGRAFCQWAGARLPSEAEWEKAARGTDGRIYPWGDNRPTKELCNFAGKVGDTTQVTQYLRGASPYGVFDMVGNVWEWTADWYAEDYYAASPAVNPIGPDNGQYRTLRGGSFVYDDYGGAHFVRCAYRSWASYDLMSLDVGFRVVSPSY